MSIRLILGCMLIALVVAFAPKLLAFFQLGPSPPESAPFILMCVATLLVIKIFLADFAGGEFLFHKNGFDNCTLAFSASLTSIAQQFSSQTDIFPGLGALAPFRYLTPAGWNPRDARVAELFALLLISLLACLLTARISSKISKNETPARRSAALGSSVLGLLMLGLYATILVSK